MSEEWAYLTDGYHKDKASITDREIYEAWSFQACPFDTANPAFFIKDRSSYRAWGKNKQKRL